MGNAIKTLPRVNDTLNLNETIHYCLALAILWDIKKVDIWGADYYSSEGKPIRADKRACTEFWIGMAAMAGIQIRTYQGSDLMRYGLHHPDTEIEGLYGYEQGNLSPEVLEQIELIGGGRAVIRAGA